MSNEEPAFPRAEAAGSDRPIGARAYLKAIGLFLLIYAAGFVLVNVALPDREPPAYPLAGLAVLVVGIAAGGRWQGLRGARQWGTYTAAAIVAWIGAAIVLATVVVVATLLLTGFTEDAGDTLGPVMDAGRIERTASGYAVTFPADWEVRAVIGGEPEPPDQLRAASAEGGTECRLRDATDYANAPPAFRTVDDAAEAHRTWATEEESLAVIDDGILELGSGRAAYVLAEQDDGRQRHTYYFSDGYRWHELDCELGTGPDDPAREIAEAFEYLPPDPAMRSQPRLLGGRIEMPGHGYAIHPSDDWVHLLPSQESIDAYVDTASKQDLDPAIVEAFESLWTEVPGLSLVLYLPREGATYTESCVVTLAPSKGMTLEQIVDRETAGEPTWTTEYLDLPAGRAARVEYAQADPFVEDLLHYSLYYWARESVVHTLACAHTRRPGDSWMSLAETLELLPY